MKIDLIFVPKHVDLGMKTCGIDYQDLVNSKDSLNFKALDNIMSKISKVDFKDLLKTTNFVSNLIKQQGFNLEDDGSALEKHADYPINPVNPIEILTMIGYVENSRNDNLIKKYNILSSETTLIPLDKLPNWLNFKRFNNTYIVILEDEFIELLANQPVVALTLFYKTFMDLLYTSYGLDVFKFYYFKNFLNFINKTKRT